MFAIGSGEAQSAEGDAVVAPSVCVAGVAPPARPAKLQESEPVAAVEPVAACVTAVSPGCANEAVVVVEPCVASSAVELIGPTTVGEVTSSEEEPTVALIAVVVVTAGAAIEPTALAPTIAICVGGCDAGPLLWPELAEEITSDGGDETA